MFYKQFLESAHCDGAQNGQALVPSRQIAAAAAEVEGSKGNSSPSPLKFI